MFLGWVRSNQTARLSVRITPRHEKRPTFAGRIHRSDIRSVAESFSRPMTGHTPQKLPLSPEQSPASSHLRAPLAICAPLYNNTRSRECQALFFNFPIKSAFPLLHYINIVFPRVSWTSPARRSPHPGHRMLPSSAISGGFRVFSRCALPAAAKNCAVHLLTLLC